MKIRRTDETDNFWLGKGQVLLCPGLFSFVCTQEDPSGMHPWAGGLLRRTASESMEKGGGEGDLEFRKRGSASKMPEETPPPQLKFSSPPPLHSVLSGLPRRKFAFRIRKEGGGSKTCVEYLFFCRYPILMLQWQLEKLSWMEGFQGIFPFLFAVFKSQFFIPVKSLGFLQATTIFPICIWRAE